MHKLPLWFLRISSPPSRFSRPPRRPSSNVPHPLCPLPWSRLPLTVPLCNSRSIDVFLSHPSLQTPDPFQPTRSRQKRYPSGRIVRLHAQSPCRRIGADLWSQMELWRPDFRKNSAPHGKHADGTFTCPNVNNRVTSNSVRLVRFRKR